MIYKFIVYGVFDDKQCLMVGSTTNLSQRRRDYKVYSWFNKDNHVHKILWSGEIEVSSKFEAHVIRATKEAAWIGRMKTWYPEGKNQANPIKQVLGGSYRFEDWGEISHRKAAIGRAKWRRENPKTSFENCRKGGKAGGAKGGKLGGKRVRDLYPGMAEANGYRQGLINSRNGHLDKMKGLGMHIRWHIKRSFVNRNCVFCRGEK